MQGIRGHITKRTYTRTRKDGTEAQRSAWRARIPDPSRPAAASAKLEATFATKREAENWLTRQGAAVQDGSFIDPRKGETPLREVVDSWKATWPNRLEPRTTVGYESLLANHIIPRFGDVAVAAITAKAVQEWVNELSATRHAETVHHAFTVLRSCLKTAVQHKLIGTNPCSRDTITLPSKKAARVAPSEQPYLTAAEVRKLADVMPAHCRLPTLVAALCGLRAGELWALRRCDVDPLHGTLHVRYAIKNINGALLAGPTKTHAARKLSVPQGLVADLEVALSSPGVRLRGIKRGSPAGYPVIRRGELGWTDDANDPERLLFTTPYGHPVEHKNFYNRVFRPAVKQLWPEGHRLRALRWHDLRHTAASLAIAATGNLGIVQKRLGHDSIETTYNRYHHLLPDADKSLADALGAMYDATAENNVVELRPAEEK